MRGSLSKLMGLPLSALLILLLFRIQLRAVSSLSSLRMTNSPNYCDCHLFPSSSALLSQIAIKCLVTGYHFSLFNPPDTMSVAFTLKQRRFRRHKSRMLMMHCRLSHWLTTASLLSVFKCNIFYCRPQKSLPSWVAVWYLTLSCFLHLASCLPYSWSNLISWTDWKRRQSLPLLSVSLIPMEHNFIFSQHCFVSHPWLLPLPPATVSLFHHS